MITTMNQLHVAWSLYDYSSAPLDGNLGWAAAELTMARSSVAREWTRLTTLGVFGPKYHDANGYVQHGPGNPQSMARHRECYERAKQAIVRGMHERGWVAFGSPGKAVIVTAWFGLFWMEPRDRETHWLNSKEVAPYEETVKAALAAERTRR